MSSSESSPEKSNASASTGTSTDELISDRRCSRSSGACDPYPKDVVESEEVKRLLLDHKHSMKRSRCWWTGEQPWPPILQNRLGKAVGEERATFLLNFPFKVAIAIIRLHALGKLANERRETFSSDNDWTEVLIRAGFEREFVEAWKANQKNWSFLYRSPRYPADTIIDYICRDENLKYVAAGTDGDQWREQEMSFNNQKRKAWYKYIDMTDKEPERLLPLLHKIGQEVVDEFRKSGKTGAFVAHGSSGAHIDSLIVSPGLTVAGGDETHDFGHSAFYTFANIVLAFEFAVDRALADPDGKDAALLVFYWPDQECKFLQADSEKAQKRLTELVQNSSTPEGADMLTKHRDAKDHWKSFVQGMRHYKHSITLVASDYDGVRGDLANPESVTWADEALDRDFNRSAWGPFGEQIAWAEDACGRHLRMCPVAAVQFLNLHKMNFGTVPSANANDDLRTKELISNCKASAIYNCTCSEIGTITQSLNETEGGRKMIDDMRACLCYNAPFSHGSYAAALEFDGFECVD